MSENERERIDALLKAATPEAATALTELEQQTDSKEVRKAARRALYLLSTRGIRPLPDVVAGESFRMCRRARRYALTLRVTMALGTGFSFEIAEPDGGKPTAVQMMLNDLSGLQSCDSLRLSRRDLQHRIQQFEQLQTNGLAFVEIPPDYGRWLLEEARELLRRQNKSSPPGVLALLPRIGVPRHDYLVSPIYEAVSVERLRADTALQRDPQALFALPWFENWFFAVEDVLRALADWENAANRTNPSASEEADAQRDRIVREVATDLFTPGARTRYVRRLEDTADILWRLAHEADAGVALYHAQELASDGPVADVAFARALVERTLIAGVAMLNEQRAERARQN